jgi:A118 family predicted phage portal protein
MNLIQWLKGVINKMIGKESIQQVLKVTPVVSTKMQHAIELWEKMYTGESPWLNENVRSLGLASLIASEKARMATLEMKVKITGDGEFPEFLKSTFSQVEDNIREQLEYGIALGGIVIKPYVVKGPNNKYKIKFNYVPASDFYPLSFSADGELTSAAFVDRVITKDKMYSKFEIHTLEDNSVTILNKAFVSDYKADMSISNQSELGREVALSSVSEWADIQPSTTIENTDTLLFAYFKNPDANIVDITSPLGVSGFARATGLIQQADEQYSNLLWEFEGGQLAVDVDRTALNPIAGASKEKVILPKLQDRLYRRNLDLGEDDLYKIFSPALRDKSIINGLNNILIHIEDACSLARGTISDVAISEARTATELKILKQRAFSANADIQKELQKAFVKIFKVIEIYCKLYNITTVGKYEVAYHWDDSILVDKDAERQQDLLDVDKGLMSKVEYRMKWKGETEKQAQEALAKIQEETRAAIELQKALMPQTSNEGSTPKEDDLNKRRRANESVETNTPNEE